MTAYTGSMRFVEFLVSVAAFSSLFLASLFCWVPEARAVQKTFVSTKVGVCLSNLRFHYDDPSFQYDTHTRTGIALACVLEYRNSQAAGFGLEVSFEQRGFQTTVYETSEAGVVLGKDDLSFGRSVLTIAPFGEIFLPLSSYLKVGPSIELGIRNNNDEFLVDEGLIDRWKSVHLGYFFAIGKDFAPKRNGLFIEAAIRFGLGNFYDSKNKDSDGALDRIVERSANITVGMRI